MHLRSGRQQVGITTADSPEEAGAPQHGNEGDWQTSGLAHENHYLTEQAANLAAL